MILDIFITICFIAFMIKTSNTNQKVKELEEEVKKLKENKETNE